MFDEFVQWLVNLFAPIMAFLASLFGGDKKVQFENLEGKQGEQVQQVKHEEQPHEE